MKNDYEGSIAQSNIDFSTKVEETVTPGENFYSLGVYMASDKVADNLVTQISAGEKATFAKYNYSTETKGDLFTMLSAFYKSGANSKVHVFVYEGDGEEANGLKVMFNTYRSYASWITMLTDTPSDFVSLAVLQSTNSDLCLPVIVNTSDYTTDSKVLQLIVTAKQNCYWFYSNDAETTYPALFQLGLSFATLNNSNTPVGNALDFWATKNFVAAGVNGENLSSSVKAEIEALNGNYFNTVGNSNNEVATVGGMDLNGNLISASWFVAYVNFCCRINTATAITRGNIFKTRTTYDIIINQIRLLMAPFISMQRLSNFKITAPSYEEVKKLSSKDSLVISNAWTATWNDGIHSVAVSGTLIIGG